MFDVKMAWFHNVSYAKDHFIQYELRWSRVFSNSPSFHPTRESKLQVAFHWDPMCYDPDSLAAWQPHRLMFFPKVPRRRQRMGCPMIRRHKDSCTSLKKFSKLRIEVEQRAKEKLNKSYDCQKCWLVFEDQHLVRHLTAGFNLLDPDRWKSAKIQVCTRRQASLDQCPVRNHRDLNVTKSWIESRPGASNERGLLDVSSPPRRGLKVANHDVVLGFVQPWLCPCKTLRASQNQGSRNCWNQWNQEKNLRRLEHKKKSTKKGEMACVQGLSCLNGTKKTWRLSSQMQVATASSNASCMKLLCDNIVGKGSSTFMANNPFMYMHDYYCTLWWKDSTSFETCSTKNVCYLKYGPYFRNTQKPEISAAVASTGRSVQLGKPRAPSAPGESSVDGAWIAC